MPTSPREALEQLPVQRSRIAAFSATITLLLLTAAVVPGQDSGIYYNRSIISTGALGTGHAKAQLNEQGDVLWETAGWSWGAAYLNFYHDGAVSDVTQSWYGRDLNQSGEVIWNNFSFQVLKDGQVSTITTPSGAWSGPVEWNNTGQFAYIGGYSGPCEWGICWDLWKCEAAAGEVTQISFNGGVEGYFHINDHGDTSWVTGESGSNRASIYLNKDGVTTLVAEHRLAYSLSMNESGQLVWWENLVDSSLNTSAEIFFYDGARIFRLTNNDLADSYPQINDAGQIIWMGNVVDSCGSISSEIFLYQNGVTTRLTDNCYNDVYDDAFFMARHPNINNSGQITWLGHNGPPDAQGHTVTTEVYLYTAGAIHRLTDNACQEDGPRINNRGDLVWSSSCAPGQSDIVLASPCHYDYQQITDNEIPDSSPRLNDRTDILWFSGDWHWGPAPLNLYSGATGTTTELTQSWYGWDLNQNGEVVWNNFSFQVWKDGQVHQVTTPSGAYSGPVEWNNTGYFAYIGGYSGACDWGTCWDVWKCNAATGEVTQVSFNGGVEGAFHINDAGDVSWLAPEPPTGASSIYINRNGVTTLVAEHRWAYSLAMNESGQLVWWENAQAGSDNNTAEIYFYDGNQVIRVTSNSLADIYPQINDIGQVLWIGYVEDSCGGITAEIFTYDHGTTTRVTDNCYDDVYDANSIVRHPNINNSGQLTWEARTGPPDGLGHAVTGEIYLYSDGSVRRLTDNDQMDTTPTINELGDVAWAGYDGHDYEIFLSRRDCRHHESVYMVNVSQEYQGLREPIAGTTVYAFNGNGTYLGKSGRTNSAGEVAFQLQPGAHQFRADYMGQRFFSAVGEGNVALITIPHGQAQVRVVQAGAGISGVKVYVFSPAGTYLGRQEVTDADGMAAIHLPAGSYKFRADYQGSECWSQITVVVADQPVDTTIDVGGGLLTLTVQRAPGAPIANVNVYAFAGSGAYLGMTTKTAANGQAQFSLATGSFKLRVDYLGYQYWTEVIAVPQTLSATLDIPHAPVVVTVSKLYQGALTPLSGLKVYLFTPSGSYLGQNQTTDTLGQAAFSLPARDYKFRADYMGGQHWSAPVNQAPAAVEVPFGLLRPQVVQAGNPLTNVSCYVFSGTGAYLGLTAKTQATGQADFSVPAGTYRVRADYQGHQYWSATADVLADQTAEPAIDVGGGVLTLTVQQSAGVPIGNVSAYAFAASGSYLGLTAKTNSNGQVYFTLASGSFKLRVDYLGYQYWTDTVQVPDNLAPVLEIPHAAVPVTVEKALLGVLTPLAGVKVYLFTPTGSYMGQVQTTDASGLASFSLPARDYKFRGDYLSGQFWSGVTNQAAVSIAIAHGVATARVSRGGAPRQGIRVYIFSASGSYLGRSGVTNAAGEAGFDLPVGSYKVRADADGTQYWSAVQVLQADQTVVFEVPT